MWLKSAYISGYITIAVLAAAYAIYHAEEASILATAGALISVVPFLLMLGYFFLVGAARTSANLKSLILMSGAGVIAALVGHLSGTDGLIPLGIALTGLLGNVIYIFWYSRFGREKNLLLEVGKPLPDFELETEEGYKVPSEIFRKQPSLLMFYRGNWCPLCMAQIKEVARMYRKLEERGIKIYLVSPQSHEQTATLAQRFDVPMNFLVDKNNQAADTLQIKAEGGLPLGLQALGYDSDTVMPTVVMTDENGIIIYADLTDNYRVRPEPEDFLKVFDEKMA